MIIQSRVIALFNYLRRFAIIFHAQKGNIYIGKEDVISFKSGNEIKKRFIVNRERRYSLYLQIPVA